jgi:hypothetical protein
LQLIFSERIHVFFYGIANADFRSAPRVDGTTFGGFARWRTVPGSGMDQVTSGEVLTSSALSATLVMEKLTHDVPQ